MNLARQVRRGVVAAAVLFVSLMLASGALAQPAAVPSGSTGTTSVAAPSGSIPSTSGSIPPTSASAPPIQQPPTVSDDDAAAQGQPDLRPRPRFTAVAAGGEIKVDGRLDEPLWAKAPSSSEFFSTISKPYGQLARDATTVQVVYSERFLYVAFTCKYAEKGDRDDGVAKDEMTLAAEAESVGFFVDSRGDRTNAYGFLTSRFGARGDVEVTNNGENLNFDWTANWEVGVESHKDSWTAEFRIPWSTLGFTGAADAVKVGLNFRRRLPWSGDVVVWSLPPPQVGPAGAAFPSFFGTLDGVSNVRPGDLVYLAPYVTGIAREMKPETALPRLNDFGGKSGRLTGYAGLYGSVRPTPPLKIDFTFNPDFSQVNPDRALSNLSRFELFRPELRPFFVRDQGLFQFGSAEQGETLFYSRRIGLKPGAGGFVDVPILYAVKSIVRTDRVALGAMNVGVAPGDTSIRPSDNISVVRGQILGAEGRRIGAIALARYNDGATYHAGGLDGVMTFADQHIVMSGYGAGTVTNDANGKRYGGAAQGSVLFDSQEVQAQATLAAFSKYFDPQLGFYPLGNVIRGTFVAGYSPQLFNDLVRTVEMRAGLDRVRAFDESLVFDTATISAITTMLNNTTIEVSVSPSVDGVGERFALGGGRLVVEPGKYESIVTRFRIKSPPRRKVEAALGYEEGQLYGGYRRIPSFELGLNLGRFAVAALYRLLLVRIADTSLLAHQTGGRVVFAYTAKARSVLAVEANTFDPSARAQFITAYTWEGLTSVALIFRHYTTNVADWARPGDRQVLLNLTYGFSPI